MKPAQLSAPQPPLASVWTKASWVDARTPLHRVDTAMLGEPGTNYRDEFNSGGSSAQEGSPKRGWVSIGDPLGYRLEPETWSLSNESRRKQAVEQREVDDSEVNGVVSCSCGLEAWNFYLNLSSRFQMWLF